MLHVLNPQILALVLLPNTYGKNFTVGKIRVWLNKLSFFYNKMSFTTMKIIKST